MHANGLDPRLRVTRNLPPSFKSVTLNPLIRLFEDLPLNLIGNATMSDPK